MKIVIKAKSETATLALKEWHKSGNILETMSTNKLMGVITKMNSKIRQVLNMGVSIDVINEDPYTVSYTNKLIKHVPEYQYKPKDKQAIFKEIFKHLAKEGVLEMDIEVAYQ